MSGNGSSGAGPRPTCGAASAALEGHDLVVLALAVVALLVRLAGG